MMHSSSPQGGLTATALILGGQKSGKSRRAELMARDWLAADRAHSATLVATGRAFDDEMRERIARHQRERAERVPGLQTLEEPLDLAGVLCSHSHPQHLLIVDCLTLWLTNWLMPAESAIDIHGMAKRNLAHDWSAQLALFIEALRTSPGPVILVGNEIGLGVIPMGREVRAFVDALGTLNQQVAQSCSRVTLMVAGLPLQLK